MVEQDLEKAKICLSALLQGGVDSSEGPIDFIQQSSSEELSEA